MRYLSMFAALLFIASNIFAAKLEIKGTVKAAAGGTPIENAVVLLKVNDGLVAYARTLSKADGTFELLPGKEAPGDITQTVPIDTTSNPGDKDPGDKNPDDKDPDDKNPNGNVPVAKNAALSNMKFESFQALDLRGRFHKSLGNLPQGVYVLLGKTEAGKNIKLGVIYHKGGNLQLSALNSKFSTPKKLAKSITDAGDEVALIVRKAGYLPTEVEISSFDEDVGTVALKRDPLESRIDSVMALMSLQDKIYQMNQALIVYLPNYGASGHLYGSLLHGGDDYSNAVLSGMRNALSSSSYSVKIPVTYGKDFVHGAAGISGATVFPHNIGLGATRDSALVRQIGEITAKESWAGQVDLIFGPAISVPQDERWGRVYEGFGETAELAVMMGAAMVRGMQGPKYNAPWRVIATAKHYLGDGATDGGKDRGNSTASDAELRAVHLPGYEAVVEQGVLSVMASFNQIRGTHQHIDSLRLIGWLKTELGFDGYVIADWAGISNSTQPGYTDACDYGCTAPTASKDAVKKAVNAGIDMAMNESNFITHLQTLVNEGSVSEERIDDAVRRILRAKFRAGRMDNIQGPNYSSIGSPDHRAVAREAVRKSLVLLKNENSALPISKTAKVYVFGSHAENTGYQCGGWTLGWSSVPNSIPGATSIKTGIIQVAGNSSADDADVIVYATGETPYAEWKGDIKDITFSDGSITQLNTYKNQGKKIVTVFISGRALETNSLLNASDAFVAAWLPGSEGAGIADALFGDHNFTGKLPHTWPRNKSVFPKNSAEQNDNWFPYGYGLSY